MTISSPQFSDMLLYANRATQQGVQFKVHGQLAVSDLQVVDSEPRMGADFCFNIYDGKRALMVAAATLAEKTQWMEDITETVQVGTLTEYFLLATSWRQFNE